MIARIVSRPSSQRIAAGVVLCLFIAAALVWSLIAPVEPRTTFADADDTALVAQGGLLYREHCASCHGANLEGQPHWQRVASNGRLPPPPLTHRGHSWMHSDAELLRRIKASFRDSSMPDYLTDMPAFDGVLNDQQMTAVLAFIKSQWPLGVRAYQAAQNPGRQGMPNAASDADWSFPIDCGQEPDRTGAPPREPAGDSRQRKTE